jgi:hypothetical protein
MMKNLCKFKRVNSKGTFYNQDSSCCLSRCCLKRKYISNEKRCNSQALWVRYIKKKETPRKTKEMKKENETIW